MSKNNEAKKIFESLVLKNGWTKLRGSRQAVVINGEIIGISICWGRPHKIRQFYSDYAGWKCVDINDEGVPTLYSYPGTLEEQNHDKLPNRITRDGLKAYTVRPHA